MDLTAIVGLLNKATGKEEVKYQEYQIGTGSSPESHGSGILK